MSEKEALLSLEGVRERLSYDPDSGIFIWLSLPAKKNGIKPGTIAGTVGNYGYVMISLNGKDYAAHRLAWFITHGYWPKYVDHLNGIRADNRIVNLQDVEFRTNIQNQRAPSKNNSTGFLGVHRRNIAYAGKPFAAQIQDPVSRKIIHLGYYVTAEEAHAAYVAKKREIHPGCTI